MGLIIKTLLVTIGCLIVADIVGVLANTIFDILPLRSVSGALFYTVWFVDGIFCGLFLYNYAGAWVTPKADPATRNDMDDWSGLPDARRIGNGVVIVATLVIAALCWFFWKLFWEFGVGEAEYYVPDSFPHSVVFFASVMGGLLFAHYSLTPERKGPIQ